MKDAALKLKELEAQIQAFNADRTEAASRKQQAEIDVQVNQQEYEALTKAIDGLTHLKSFYAVASVGEGTKQPLRRTGTNREQIVEILTAHKDPMTIAEIARIATEERRLRSANGYKGIYALVATNLSRNSKHVFIHLNGGKWDLRSRRLNFTPGSSPRKESAGPISIKSRALDMALSQIEKQFGPTPDSGGELGRAASLARENREKARNQN